MENVVPANSTGAGAGGGLLVRAIRSDLGGAIEDRLLSIARPQREASTEHLVCVLGMRRTGNHAIIDWMRGSVGGRTLHINNIVVGMSGYRLRGLYPERGDSDDQRARMCAGRMRRFEQLDALICSFEDYDFSSFDAEVSHPRFQRWHGRARRLHKVLLLRDPYNLFASRIKSGKTAVRASLSDQKGLFIDQAEAFLHERESDRVVCVSYNHWFVSPSYRAQIQARLGVAPGDVPIDFVPRYGGGSSFDGVELSGRASQMGVLSRWRSMQGDPVFEELFDDGVLARYSREIFGELDPAQVEARVAA